MSDSKTYTATTERNGITFRADMAETRSTCTEQVHAFDTRTGAGLGLIHGASFASSCLGSADRGEYVRTMLFSTVDGYFRKAHGRED